MSRSFVRVYLLHEDIRRSFYWFQSAPDGSIYFGSSNTSTFNVGFSGVSQSSTDSLTTVTAERDGRAMTSAELKNKISFHGSGVVNDRSETDGVRDRYRLRPLQNGTDSLPLVSLLLMHPERYPEATRRLRSSDLVIRLDAFALRPVAVLFYLLGIDATEPLPVAGARATYEQSTKFVASLGEHSLHAFVYHDASRMQAWSNLQVTVKALPKTPGAEVGWPFFYGWPKPTSADALFSPK
jgi:hypothetical protein